MKNPKSIKPEQHTLAKALLALSDNRFRLRENEMSGYIVLDRQVGKSTNHKNAVSILSNRVSFMVANFVARREAKALGLRTKRNLRRRALQFPHIDLQSIERNESFFKSLLTAAEQESVRRQKQGGLGPEDPDTESGSEFIARLELSAEIKLEKQGGFQSNPHIRKAVENRAMEVVYSHFKHLSPKDTSKTCPYDYSYVDGKTCYIEVKGSQLKDPSIVLTPNEVEFAKSHAGLMKLCVVHSITVENPAEPVAKGGVLVEYASWDPNEHTLSITQYQCKLNPGLGSTK